MSIPRLLTTWIPFPAIAWWSAALQAERVLINGQAPFRKMSDRNRYRIATAGGAQLLSLPLAGGRGQRGPVQDVQLADGRWQEQHWRTVFSAYGRAPFFQHFAPELEAIYKADYQLLREFCAAALQWSVRALRLPPGHFIAASGSAEESGGGQIDWRQLGPAAYEAALVPGARYHQVFGERHGFLPGMSILDLLLNEGPAAGDWLRQNAARNWFP